MVQEIALRTVGHRKTPLPAFHASPVLLAEGARFNDAIHRLPTGNRTFVRKGVYRFKSHEQADQHDIDCVVAGVAGVALERW
jgi:hypothetical protein